MRKRRGILFRARHWLLAVLLAALLAVVNVVLGGCEDEEPAVYYGPPPSDLGADAAAGDAGLDVALPVDTGPTGQDVRLTDTPIYGPDNVVDDIPSVYYGPPPVDALEDTPAVYYGPPPVDAVGEDTPAVYYGPQPTDVAAPDDMMAVYYGPMPVDVGDDDTKAPDTWCEPAVYYGPPPCHSDAECVESFGPGWVCNEEYTMTDPCGQPMTWPSCEPEQQ